MLSVLELELYAALYGLGLNAEIQGTKYLCNPWHANADDHNDLRIIAWQNPHRNKQLDIAAQTIRHTQVKNMFGEAGQTSQTPHMKYDWEQ